MSQGAEKSQPPEVGIEPGPQDLKANTQPRRCKSRFLPQGSRSELYLPIPTTYFPALNIFVPESARNHAVILEHSILMPETQATDPHNGHQMSQGAEKSQPPEVGIEPGPQDLKANTQPLRCKSRLLPHGSRSELYLPIPTTNTFHNESKKFLRTDVCS